MEDHELERQRTIRISASSWKGCLDLGPVRNSAFSMPLDNPTKFLVVVPVLNAADCWPDFARSLLAAVAPERVLVIDSSSTDGTLELAKRAGFQTHSIRRNEFNHGGTRQLAIDRFADIEVFVFMTQDAILASPEAIALLLTPFSDPEVGAVYGRQLPHAGATPIEAHARLFNYPEQSSVRTLESRRELGLKAAFLSNSFSAYRRTALAEVGGFPSDVIFGEDMVAAARMLLAGWKTAYVAEARVYHSHSYSFLQEFRRYFDVGVLHAREAWLQEQFGGAGGEGKRFVLSEMAYLRRGHLRYIPSALVRTTLKLTGYRLGRLEARLPLWLKRRLSMNRNFWKAPTGFR